MLEIRSRKWRSGVGEGGRTTGAKSERALVLIISFALRVVYLMSMKYILSWCLGTESPEMPKTRQAHAMRPLDADSLLKRTLPPLLAPFDPKCDDRSVYPEIDIEMVHLASVAMPSTMHRSPLKIRECVFEHLMRCMWQLSRCKVFDHNASIGCAVASRYMSEPETDAWGALAMTLSVANEWMHKNYVDVVDHETLAALAGIVSACLKFACDQEIGSIFYLGTEIGVEVRILGVLCGQNLEPWFNEMHRDARELQAVLDHEVMCIVRSMPLHQHYTQNAQARAEKVIFELYESRHQVETFDAHDMYRALRALSTFFFASFYDNLYIVLEPQRHAVAIVNAILASGGYRKTVDKKPGSIKADSRDVLRAVLRTSSEDRLPMPVVFKNGGHRPHDEWAVCDRVRRALSWLS